MHTYGVIIKIDTNFPHLEVDDVCILHQRIGNNIEVQDLRSHDKATIPSEMIEEFDINQTGDRFDKKVCDRCFKLLDTDTKFENNRIKKDNVITKRPSCRSCRKIKNGKSIPTKQKKIWEAKRPAQFTPFTCPICEKTTIAGISKVVLDHNHHTGDVRGYLCESCNTGIGRFDDNPEQIKRALKWLKDSDSEH